MNQDIKIANVAEGASDKPQTTAILVDGLGRIGRANEHEEAAHAPAGDPHLMHRFDVLACATARFVTLHSVKLNGKKLATGFRHWITQQYVARSFGLA